MTRPSDLPEYESPPLVEVNLGVQFDTPSRFKHIYAKEIWDLFSQTFPKLKEREALPSSSETFSPNDSFTDDEFRHSSDTLTLDTLSSHNTLIRKLSTRSPKSGKQYCFISTDNTEMIQFQSDRLHHHWQKIEESRNEVEEKSYRYPRFETILPNFEKELKRLNDYFCTRYNIESIAIKQCELTYVNHIYLHSDMDELNHWLRLVKTPQTSLERLSLTTTQLLYDEQKNPFGRLTCYINTLHSPSGKPVVECKISVKGHAMGPSIADALCFLIDARSSIVHCFTDITTEKAHQCWKRTT